MRYCSQHKNGRNDRAIDTGLLEIGKGIGVPVKNYFQESKTQIQYIHDAMTIFYDLHNNRRIS